jgi:hypothetical protein
VTVTVCVESRRANGRLCFRNECRAVVWPKSTLIEWMDSFHVALLVLRRTVPGPVDSTPLKLKTISKTILRIEVWETSTRKRHALHHHYTRHEK